VRIQMGRREEVLHLSCRKWWRPDCIVWPGAKSSMMETSSPVSRLQAADEEPSGGNDKRNSAELTTTRRRDDLIRDFDRTFGFTPPHANRSPSNAQTLRAGNEGSDRLAPAHGGEQGQTVSEHFENLAGSPVKDSCTAAMTLVAAAQLCGSLAGGATGLPATATRQRPCLLEECC
jgi:hypothetical protein